MENKQTSNVEELFYKLRDYGETRLDLFKLKSIDKASGILSSVIVTIVLILLLFLVFGCITVGLSLLIGSFLGKAYYGFFIMAAVYIIIGLILFLGRKKYLKTPLSKVFIKELLN